MRLLISILLFLPLPLSAAIRLSDDVTVAGVSNAIFGASPGDTVIVTNTSGPLTAVWTNGVFITNWLTLQFAPGVIVSNWACAPAADVRYRYPFNWNLNSHSSTCYMGNFTIQEAPGQTNASSAILVEGNNQDGRRMALTNFFIFETNGFGVVVESALGGIRHGWFSLEGNAVAVYGYHRVWNGGTLGHGAWATNDNFGTDQFWFIERTVMTRPTPYTSIDGYAGWRYCLRYSLMTNATAEGHGPETPAGRGTRAVEIYGNIFDLTDQGQITSFVRSGVRLESSNLIVRCIGQQPFKLPYYRQYENLAQWGPANGTNHYDTNIAGGPFYSGTVSATNLLDARVFGISVSGTPFDVNEYQGYSIIKTSDGGSIGGNTHSIIVSNSTSQLYYARGELAQMRFTAADTFDIYKVEHPLDGHGYGKGDLLTGSGTFFPNYNNQELTGCYEWDNVNGSAGNMNFETNYANLLAVSGVHYFQDTPKPGWSRYTEPNPIFTPGAAPPAASHGIRQVHGGSRVVMSGNVTSQ